MKNQTEYRFAKMQLCKIHFPSLKMVKILLISTQWHRYWRINYTHFFEFFIRSYVNHEQYTIAPDDMHAKNSNIKHYKTSMYIGPVNTTFICANENDGVVYVFTKKNTNRTQLTPIITSQYTTTCKRINFSPSSESSCT